VRRNRYYPAINKKQLALKGLLLITTLGILSFIFVMWYLLVVTHPYFQIKEVKTIGNKRLTKSEILTWLKLYPGQSLLNLHLRWLKQRLISYPLIEEANVSRKWPDRLIISLKEREPLALIYDGPRLWSIDRKGVWFYLKEYPDLPIITGAYRDSPYLKETIDLLVGFKHKKWGISLAEISKIHLDQDLGVTFYTTSGTEVYLGKEHYKEKLCSLHKILIYLNQTGLKDIKRVDLNQVNKVYVGLG